MDTVAIAGMTIPPFDPQIRDNRIFGRGSVDVKCGLAAMMHALAGLHQSRFTPPSEIWFVAAVDEEFSFRGVTRLCQNLSATGAVVCEPTDLRIAIASKGVLRWRILVKGKAAHTSKPHLGRNAIVDMMHVIQALETHTATLAAKPHPLLGPATLTVSVIHGGIQINTVPEDCVIELDRRLLPGEDWRSVMDGYDAILQQLRASHGIHATNEAPLLTDLPLETQPDASIVQSARTVLQSMSRDPIPLGVPYGSDASKLAAIGIPTIIIGPGSIDQAHAAIEYVEIPEVEAACALYTQLMKDTQ